MGNRYQNRALAFRQIATAKRQLLTDLQVKILYNRPAKQLGPYLNNPTIFKKESQAFINRLIAEQQEINAEIALQQASILRNQIVTGSLILSVALAALIAFYTSSAIAQPVQTVTQIARQVTEEDNFNLQANVNSKGEMAVLAHALNWIEIAIADNGIGIPQNIQNRIFDPFFTTKPIGKGTGMGMSISYQIITQKHQGKLFFHSTPGGGTEFIIQIPQGLSPHPAKHPNANNHNGFLESQ
ncbi:MAG: ATP-binding protein [Jaaginema sp. PMC 1080.18]|nr:ATP-binding protein [Jaaginema sp. PMC 1080.18]MEC4867246.1 ATP-binding protein [Jaaginema sp. PMC 1078.18]